MASSLDIKRTGAVGATPAPDEYPLIARGARGPAVASAQHILAELGFYSAKVDGDFSTATERAVRDFQRSVGLDDDGIVGRSTWPALYAAQHRVTPLAKTSAVAAANHAAPESARVAAQQIAPTANKGLTLPTPKQSTQPQLKEGTRGPAVEQLQRQLIDAGYALSPDGRFGPNTAAELRRFQEDYELPPSGVADAATWSALRVATAGADPAKSLRLGMSGPEVVKLQQLLSAGGFTVTPDGAFGRKTRDLILSFQCAVGLPGTGIANLRTWTALEQLQPPQQLAKGALAAGARGPEVLRLQRALADLGYPVALDSTFGVQTVTAVLRFMDQHGMPLDGVVDADVWARIKKEQDDPASLALRSYSPGQLFEPKARDTVELFRLAAQRAGVPAGWADSSALHEILKHESHGYVGRPNFTYAKTLAKAGFKQQNVEGWKKVHADLKAGTITARSSATGLGQLLSRNVHLYYPSGLDGIGVPLQEAVGMLRYIAAAYGTPERAWALYQKGVGY